MEVRMDLARVVICETRDYHFIVLKERNGSRELPIVIGGYEAVAIDRRVKGEQAARPQTHDLLGNVVELLNGQIEKIVINDLHERTFYAKIVIRQNGEFVEVDSRPSDAIALGVATDVPIYVEEHVLRDVTE